MAKLNTLCIFISLFAGGRLLLGPGRLLTSEKSHTRRLLDNVGDKNRRLSDLRNEIDSFREHVISRLGTLSLFTEKVRKLKKEEIELQESIRMQREAKSRLEEAKRKLLQEALLQDNKH